MKQKIAIIAIIVSLSPFLAHASRDFSNPTLPQTLSGTLYTDYIRGCANGGTNNPCANWYIIFFTSTTTYGTRPGDPSTSNQPVGTGDLYVGNYIGGGYDINLQNGAYQVNCTVPDFSVCDNSGGGGGSIPVTNGTTENISVAQYFQSTRNVLASSTGDVLYDTSNRSDTRIVSFTPLDRQQIYSTNATGTFPVTFTVHVYVNPDDIGDYIKVRVLLDNFDQNYWLFGSFSQYSINLVNEIATTSGHLYYSTTTNLANGNYKVTANITGCITVFNLYSCGAISSELSGIDETQYHEFIVGQSTFIGTLAQNTRRDIEATLASTTATSTAALASNCNPLSFSITYCLSFLFIPDSRQLTATFNYFYNSIGSHVPLSYISDIAEIFLSTTTRALVVMEATVPVGIPGAGSHIELDLTRSLDRFLYATSTFRSAEASSTDTLYDITSYYWDIVVYLGLALYLLRRVVGSSLIPNLFNSSKMDDLN